MKTKNKLQQKYYNIVRDYIIAFQKKQELEFDYWIGDNIGEMAAFGDYYFSFDDIRYDIDNDIDKELILEWHNNTTDYALKHNTTNALINYRSYCNGLRYKDL